MEVKDFVFTSAKVGGFLYKTLLRINMLNLVNALLFKNF